MQSALSSKRLGRHEKLCARVSQLGLISKTESQGRNMEWPLLAAHPHGSLGLHALKLRENSSQGWLLLQQ